MYVVIVGCGKIGRSLAKALTAAEHEVLVIDRDSQRCEAVEEDLGSVSIVGDGCESNVMLEAGVKRADVFIATTGNDEDNLAACQMAKHRFDVPKTIALVNNSINNNLFELLGVDVAISSTDLILSHIEEELPTHPLVHLTPIAGSNRELVGIRVPPGATSVGRALKDITLPAGTLVSLIISRDGHTAVPGEDTLIRPYDEVVVVTTPEDEEDLRRALTSEES